MPKISIGFRLSVEPVGRVHRLSIWNGLELRMPLDVEILPSVRPLIRGGFVVAVLHWMLISTTLATQPMWQPLPSVQTPSYHDQSVAPACENPTAFDSRHIVQASIDDDQTTPPLGDLPWYVPNHDTSEFGEYAPYVPADDVWTCQVMPTGLMYRSYLAGAKEPRFAGYWSRDSRLGDLWDTSLGGRLGLFRYGTCDPVFPQGIQVDMEGGCQARLDPDTDSNPLFSVDFRVGIPVTFAFGQWQFKTGYYHISSHLGDEYLIANPGARRLNYARDAIMLGVGYFWTERLRLYGETAYALNANDGAQPLEFQAGFDWAPAGNTGLRGAPFAAVNGHVREELDFGGNFVLQGGWAWRQFPRGSLLRIGLEYYRGKSDQYEYYDQSEERFGWGIWVDF